MDLQRLQADAFEVMVIKGGVRCMSVVHHRYAGADLYLARWVHMLGARKLRRPAQGLHHTASGQAEFPIISVMQPTL
jgi:hypothetical protein